MIYMIATKLYYPAGFTLYRLTAEMNPGGLSPFWLKTPQRGNNGGYNINTTFTLQTWLQIIPSDEVEMRWTHWDWTAGGTWSRRSLCGPPAAPAAWWPAPDLSGPDLTEWPQLGTVWTRAPPENTEPRPWLRSCIQCVPLAHKLWQVFTHFWRCNS